MIKTRFILELWAFLFLFTSCQNSEEGFVYKIQSDKETRVNFNPDFKILFPKGSVYNKESLEIDSVSEVKKIDHEAYRALGIGYHIDFSGGDEARIKYLQENIIYPEMAKEHGIQGTVYVAFVVEKDGSITNVKILRGIGGGCDEEAIRIIKNMPKWNPGKQHGRPVRAQYNMPIRFVSAG